MMNYLFKLNLVTNFQEVVIAKCICAITTSIEQEYFKIYL